MIRLSDLLRLNALLAMTHTQKIDQNFRTVPFSFFLDTDGIWMVNGLSSRIGTATSMGWSARTISGNNRHVSLRVCFCVSMREYKCVCVCVYGLSIHTEAWQWRNLLWRAFWTNIQYIHSEVVIVSNGFSIYWLNLLSVSVCLWDGLCVCARVCVSLHVCVCAKIRTWMWLEMWIPNSGNPQILDLDLDLEIGQSTNSGTLTHNSVYTYIYTLTHA